MVQCPRCGSENVRKKGRRLTGSGERRIFQCSECGRRFTEGLAGLHYPPHMVSQALTLYNLGRNLEEVARELRRRYRVRVSKSTVSRWMDRFRDMAPFLTLRKEALRQCEGGLVVEREFTHRGMTYPFAYHRYKLALRCEDFPGLKEYIENFSGEGRFFEEGGRCSQIRVEVKVRREEKVNLASRMAAFVLQGVKVKKGRHREIERFMLVNDSATVAVEVPVYYYEKRLRENISGHIDILQVRFGNVHILDYKPEAESEHPESQLYLYALALSFRTGVPLERIRCAWFNDEVYYEFSPAEARVNY